LNQSAYKIGHTVGKQRYIVVAGNMGVGKSTLVRFLSSTFNAQAFYEPVDGNPYFDKFFKDMRGWAFHSQIYFLTHKFKIHQEVQASEGLVVVDRSIYEDAEIFAQSLYNNHQMTKDDFDLYWSLYESMLKTLRPPDLIIYLTCSIKTLAERIKKRARKAEEEVPLQHLSLLQQSYDAWISRVNFCEVIKFTTDNFDYIFEEIPKKEAIQKLIRMAPPAQANYFLNKY
jgi:deoxyadenosine/deoxycytidine kinase